MKQNEKKKIAELSAGGDAAAVNGSFLAGDGSDVTVALFADGSAQPRYTATVPAGEKNGGKYTAVYDIPSVAAGTYTMQVSKKDHVTRAYTVTVGTEAVTQDVRIHLKGDINGDGKVNTSDVGKVNAHAKEKNCSGDLFLLS